MPNGVDGMRKTTQMRGLLAQPGKVLVSPGVYDGYSAKLAERAGFQAISTTGPASPIAASACRTRA